MPKREIVLTKGTLHEKHTFLQKIAVEKCNRTHDFKDFKFKFPKGSLQWKESKNISNVTLIRYLNEDSKYYSFPQCLIICPSNDENHVEDSE